MRPQYTTAICGACGKKKAFVNMNVLLSSGRVYCVRCMACKIEKTFHQYGLVGLPSITIWPGSLELAAAMLRGSETKHPERVEVLRIAPETKKNSESITPVTQKKSEESTEAEVPD